MSDRYFKEHIFSHPPDEGHIGSSSDFVIRWHPSRGQLRVDGLNLHPELWKSHKNHLESFFWHFWRMAKCALRTIKARNFLSGRFIFITLRGLGYNCKGQVLRDFAKKSVRFPGILRCMDFESRNTKLYGSGSICSKAIQRTKPDSHDAIIVIARKKRYTCAVASLQSPASDSHCFVFT